MSAILYYFHDPMCSWCYAFQPVWRTIKAKLEPQVEVILRPVEFGHETIGDGSGTYFGGEFFLETDRNLHDVRISAEYTDGLRPLGKADLGSADLIQLR